MPADGLDLVQAASAPTAGGTGAEPDRARRTLHDQIVVIIGAGGGVGSYAAQFAVNAGASVTVLINAGAEKRMRSYGAAEAVIRVSTAPA